MYCIRFQWENGTFLLGCGVDVCVWGGGGAERVN